MEISGLSTIEEEEWDDFVLRFPNASFTHLISWKKIVEKTYGHKALYLTARSCGQLCGILPLFLIKSRLFGNSIASLPGGVCAQNMNAALELVDSAIQMTKKMNASYTLIRDSSQKILHPEVKNTAVYSHMIIELPNDECELWSQLKPRARSKVRKALRNNLEVKLSPDYLEKFHEIIVRNYQRLGTPAFGVALLQHTLTYLKKMCVLLTIHYKNNIIGGMFSIKFRNSLNVIWASSDPQYFNLLPNYLGYWEVLRYGCSNSFKYANLGTSRVGSGNYQFKSQWNADPVSIYNVYFLNRIRYIPDALLLTEQYRLLRTLKYIWAKLPLKIVKLFGPRLSALYPLAF